ncbi:MAG: FAD-binding protein [Candidatus Ranarchaeia archaeon]
MYEAYPGYMHESLAKVEETRQQRIGANPPLMSLAERDEVLHSFHPDYKEGTKRALMIGVNKGDIMPHEVVDLLEAHPMISPASVDPNKIDYNLDLLIIGGGGAGMAAAIWATEEGLQNDRLMIVQKLRLGDSNSKMSQGGVQASSSEDDSPVIHFLDAIGGGHFTNKPELVKILVQDAPLIIRWHEELGVMYDKDKNGNLVLAMGGGTSKPRMISAKDYTGLEITRVVMDEVINRSIPVKEFTAAVSLLLDDTGTVSGAVLYDMEKKEYYIARAKATILATGGFGRLHIQGFPTTNHYGATNDGVVMAYHVGAKLRDLDATQFHPTGSAYPEQIVGLLCTEKLRGRGAQPVNSEGNLFVNPLEPRDVESAAILRECFQRNKGVRTPTGMIGVWLDTPLIDVKNGSGTIQREFAAMYLKYKRFGIDMTKEPILVSPTLHYQNGGVEINEKNETSVPGLFAAGEVCGGVHGKNRLMGNSIMDWNVFGRRAGINATRYIRKRSSIGKLSLDHLLRYEKMLREAKIKTKRKAPILLPEYRGKRTLTHQITLL